MAQAATMMTGQTVRTRSSRSRTETLDERNQQLFQEQRKGRRGPTLEVFFSKNIDNSRLVKANDPLRQREMNRFLMAMSLLFMLVMVYVWQHFAAIEVGYHVEAQKTQVEQLQEQNRELRLREAQLTDPSRIDRMAKQLGLNAPLPGQIVRPNEMETSGTVVAQTSIPGEGTKEY